MDKDGYPEEHELKTITGWAVSEDGVMGLIDYIKERWKYADCGYFELKGNELYLSTGGWSGNEDIILALQENRLFWIMYWFSSQRGGHYIFRLQPTLIKE